MSEVEIKHLEEQKQTLIYEIDRLEKKLTQLKGQMDVDGKITLQCGTQVQINPQFHLKLDPNRRGIEHIIIYAELFEMGYPERITLWERWGRRAID